MLYRDRNGAEFNAGEGQDKTIRRLYCTGFGRFLLKIITRPWLSELGGWFLDRSFSSLWVSSFAKKSKIDMSDYESRRYKSFNDFFTRQIKEGKRPVDCEPTHFVSPCDSKLTVSQIDDESKFMVKDTEYTMESLLRDGELAKEYRGGLLFLFRLSVDDYHRYCYPVSGEKGRNHVIKGFFHTVNPQANDVYPIYKENTRSYCILENDEFGEIIMMEVGALLVGRIVNYHEEGRVSRGEEKGRFEFGGSTIIVCTKADRVEVDGDILRNSKEGVETKVRYGERIGAKK